MQPRVKITLLLLLTIGGILPLAAYLTVPAAHGMTRFSSYTELENFLLTRTNCYRSYTGNNLALYNTQGLGPRTAPPGALDASNPSVFTAGTASVSATPSHSETNNQVSGVDELDTVKTDGQYIYTVTNNTVAIINAYPITSAQLVSRISLVNQTIDGIFIDGNSLTIVSEAPHNFYPENFYCGGGMGVASFGLMPTVRCLCYPSYQVQNTSISVYDLTNRSSPTLRTEVTVNGTFVGARQISGFVYLVASTPAVYNVTLPETVVNGQVIRTTATQIYHSDVSDSAFSYTTIVSLDDRQSSSSPSVQTFMLGTSSTIYVSSTNIFLTQPTWDSAGETVIHRISISTSSINYVATGSVPGHVLNQFSMDEYNGFLRVATSGDGWSQTQTSVYVLGESMKIIGSLQSLSPGETFHAARFIGDRAYLVTFKRQDPLFVLNMQDPSNPTLMGQLNVTGVSDYLQPYDSGHLIGIGQSAQDVLWEDAARFTGLKISLFEVSNPNKPSDLSDFTIGDQGTYSPALTDQKAILFDKSLNLLVLPIDVYGQASAGTVPVGYSGYYQGAFVFQVTVQGGVVFRGSITQIPSGQQYSYVSSALSITRSLYIGNTLYTISNAMIKMNSLSDLSDQGFVSLV